MKKNVKLAVFLLLVLVCSCSKNELISKISLPSENEVINFSPDPSVISEYILKLVSLKSGASDEYTNISLGKEAFGSDEISSEFAKKYAIDGVKSTLWKSDPANDLDFIGVDLGEVTIFHGVQLFWDVENIATSYEIYLSDDAITWSKSTGLDYNTVAGNRFEGNFLKARYISVLCKKKQSESFGLKELEILQKKNPPFGFTIEFKKDEELELAFKGKKGATLTIDWGNNEVYENLKLSGYEDTVGFITSYEGNASYKVQISGDILDISYFEIKRKQGTKSIVSDIRISEAQGLIEFWCIGRNIAEINLRENTGLTTLQLSLNRLKELDISKNKSLIDLFVSNNNISKLSDLSANELLVQLYIGANSLKKINVKKLKNLQSLSVHSNNLSAIDVSSNSYLKLLVCSYNNLKQVDVSGLSELQVFDVKNNLLEKINVTKNNELLSFSIAENKVEELDLSNNSKLKQFWGQNNKLKILDFTSCSEISKLDCSKNQLSEVYLANTFDERNLKCDFSQNKLTCCAVNEIISLIYNWVEVKDFSGKLYLKNNQAPKGIALEYKQRLIDDYNWVVETDEKVLLN